MWDLESQTFRAAAPGTPGEDCLVQPFGQSRTSHSKVLRARSQHVLNISGERDFTSSVENVFLFSIISALKCFSLPLTAMSPISVVPIFSCHISCPELDTATRCVSPLLIWGESWCPCAWWPASDPPGHQGVPLQSLYSAGCPQQLLAHRITAAQVQPFAPLGWISCHFCELLWMTVAGVSKTPPSLYQLQSFTGDTLTHCPHQ